MDSIKNVFDDKLRDRIEFLTSLKDECIREKKIFACY